MNLPLVTVVVLAYNRREALRQTLEKMTGSISYPQERLEVIVVDNASEDGTPEMVTKHFAQVKLLANDENIGVAGWNQGFRLGKGDYFLILDDDCYLEGDGLEKAVRAAQKQDADLVSFTVESGITTGFVFNDRYNTGWLSFWGCAALVSRRAINQLGGYDPHIFLWANELEFTMRLLNAGMRHFFLKEVRAVHMKKPKPTTIYDYRAHWLNMKHFAYIAGKLLQPVDAFGALANLLTNLLTSALKHPQAFSIVPALVAGFRLGWHNRQPLRPEVSTVYRWHFHEFANSLPYKLRYRRPEEFYKKRSAFYPSSSGVFSIP